MDIENFITLTFIWLSEVKTDVVHFNLNFNTLIHFLLPIQFNVKSQLLKNKRHK